MCVITWNNTHTLGRQGVQCPKTQGPGELNNGLSLPIEVDDTGVTLC